MARVLAGLILAILLVGCACTQEKDDGSRASPKKPAVSVDPMVLVVLYHTDFERLLTKHDGDCEGTLAALMRFVADHRQEFLQRVSSKPSDWHPDQARSKKSVDLLMEFGANCPSQVARLNQAIHAVTGQPDGS